MKKLPSEKEMTEALKTTKTNTISPSWLQRRFTLTYDNAEKLFGEMQGLGLIDRNGEIQIVQNHSIKDEF